MSDNNGIHGCKMMWGIIRPANRYGGGASVSDNINREYAMWRERLPRMSLRDLMTLEECAPVGHMVFCTRRRFMGLNTLFQRCLEERSGPHS